MLRSESQINRCGPGGMATDTMWNRRMLRVVNQNAAAQVGARLRRGQIGCLSAKLMASLMEHKQLRSPACEIGVLSWYWPLPFVLRRHSAEIGHSFGARGEWASAMKKGCRSSGR